MSDYCVCADCGCKHLVWEKSCPYCRRIKELDKELDIASNTIAKLDAQVAYLENIKKQAQNVSAQRAAHYRRIGQTEGEGCYKELAAALEVMK